MYIIAQDRQKWKNVEEAFAQPAVGSKGVAYGMVKSSLLEVKRVSSVFSRRATATKKPSISCDHRPESICRTTCCDPQPKACFDMRNVVIERGNICHAKLIYSYLYTHHWPREPTITGLWMSPNSCYLHQLSEKYAFSGDRFLALELEPRTGERRLIGLAIGYKVFPWTADELEDWAHYSDYRPDRHRLYFNAHCLRSPNLFTKYHADYLYDVEILSTASQVERQGVAKALLRAVMKDAKELRHPVLQIIAYNAYAARICPKVGLKWEWGLNYSDYVDEAGQRVFFPRSPHLSVSVWSKPFSCAYGSAQPYISPW